jgi:hypothetical protein
MPRTGEPASETMRVGTEEMGLLGRYGGTFAVADAAVRGKCGLLAAQGQRCGLLAVDVPGVEQVQVQRARGGFGNVCLVGQARHRVLGGEAGDVVRRLHGLRHCRRRKIGGAGIAATLPQVDRDRQALVAVALDVLEFPLAYRDTQAAAFGGFCRRIGGTQAPGVCQRGMSTRSSKKARL